METSESAQVQQRLDLAFTIGEGVGLPGDQVVRAGSIDEYY